MSFCDECPMSLPDIFSPRYCALGILDIDACPHAAALRAVAENPGLVLVAVERGMTNCAKADLSIPGKCAPFADKCPCDKWEFAQ